MIKKLYLDSLIGQIADLQPMKSPVGKIAALYSVYSGLGSSAETNTPPDGSFLIITHDITDPGLAVDSTFSIGGSTFKVRDIEANYSDATGIVLNYKLIISRETGTVVPALTNAVGSATIDYVTANRAAMKKLFRAYSGTVVSGKYVGYPYGIDQTTGIQYLGFETRTIPVASASRKLKSKFSQEQIQEWKAIYNEKWDVVAGEAIANEVRQEIDKEFITYIKFIAKLSATTLILTNSIAAAPSGALQDVTFDIVVNILIAIEQMVKDIKRNRKVFILADPLTAAFLQANPLFSPETDNENPYKCGFIGKYPLYSDLYAETGEYYVLIGYQGTEGNEGDTGIIYSPYTTTIHTATDTNFKENIMYLDRYAMTRHPQDTGNVKPDSPWDSANQSNSDFFKMFLVDYTTDGLSGGAATIWNVNDTTIPKWIVG